MEDLDNNQFQPNVLHDIADDTVAQTGVENRANHVNDDEVHMANNRTPGKKNFEIARVRHSYRSADN